MLDTAIFDTKLKLFISQMNHHVEKCELENELKKKIQDDKYVEKVLANYDVELNILNDSISNKLNYTKVILFKAFENSNSYGISNINKMRDYIINELHYNGVDTILQDMSQLQLVKLNSASHQNILEQDEIRNYFL